MLSRKAAVTVDMSCGPKLAADRIAPKRQRQSGHLLPPPAEIHDAVQA